MNFVQTLKFLLSVSFTEINLEKTVFYIVEGK